MIYLLCIIWYLIGLISLLSVIMSQDEKITVSKPVSSIL